MFIQLERERGATFIELLVAIPLLIALIGYSIEVTLLVINLKVHDDAIEVALSAGARGVTDYNVVVICEDYILDHGVALYQIACTVEGTSNSMRTLSAVSNYNLSGIVPLNSITITSRGVGYDG